MALATRTTTTRGVRITPPPDCRILPKQDFDYRHSCDSIDAWNWNGCPSGYTAAGSYNGGGTLNFARTTFWSRGTDGSSTPTSINGYFFTDFMVLACCPDVLSYSEGQRGGNCRGQVSTERVLVYTPSIADEPPTTTTLTPSQEISAYVVRASFARIHEVNTEWWYTTRANGGRASTVWCRSFGCRDLPTDLGPRQTMAAAQPKPYVVQPPPGMEKFGSLGIMAISLLLVAVLFGAVVLAPWAFSYRNRRLAQRVQLQ